MGKKELEILKKLQSGNLDSSKLLEIYDEYKDNYRIKSTLIQHPSFPVDTALNIISSLFVSDILKITKNKRTNPFIRKKCEIEFSQRYNKIPKGEKISLLKIAPLNLLEHFIGEQDEKILKTIIENPNCTESLIIKLINREIEKRSVYSVLIDSRWINNREICYAMSFDRELPIKVWIAIIGNIKTNRLKELSNNHSIHEIVRKNILGILKRD